MKCARLEATAKTKNMRDSQSARRGETSKGRKGRDKEGEKEIPGERDLGKAGGSDKDRSMDAWQDLRPKGRIGRFGDG